MLGWPSAADRRFRCSRTHVLGAGSRNHWLRLDASAFANGLRVSPQMRVAAGPLKWASRKAAKSRRNCSSS